MASLTASSSLTHAWRAAALRLLATALVLAIGFHETWAAMFQVWMQSETYGHGLVVAPISAWLLWRIRDRWLAVTPGMSWWGLPLVVLGSAGWLVAELAKVNVAAQYGLLMILWGLTWTALGSAVVRLMLFPLAFLFFMVPAGDSLNAPLMEATATATIAALRAVGLPVYREGMLFTLPTGSWSVVEACSGVRYLIASFMVGSLFAYL
ncbi:MAG: exosortase A, partial [Burkholderiales bacterium]